MLLLDPCSHESCDAEKQKCKEECEDTGKGKCECSVKPIPPSDDDDEEDKDDPKKGGKGDSKSKVDPNQQPNVPGEKPGPPESPKTTTPGPDLPEPPVEPDPGPDPIPGETPPPGPTDDEEEPGGLSFLPPVIRGYVEDAEEFVDDVVETVEDAVEETKQAVKKAIDRVKQAIAFAEKLAETQQKVGELVHRYRMLHAMVEILRSEIDKEWEPGWLEKAIDFVTPPWSRRGMRYLGGEARDAIRRAGPTAKIEKVLLNELQVVRESLERIGEGIQDAKKFWDLRGVARLEYVDEQVETELEVMDVLESLYAGYAVASQLTWRGGMVSEFLSEYKIVIRMLRNKSGGVLDSFWRRGRAHFWVYRDLDGIVRLLKEDGSEDRVLHYSVSAWKRELIRETKVGRAFAEAFESADNGAIQIAIAYASLVTAGTSLWAGLAARGGAALLTRAALIKGGANAILGFAFGDRELSWQNALLAVVDFLEGAVAKPGGSGVRKIVRNMKRAAPGLRSRMRAGLDMARHLAGKAWDRFKKLELKDFARDQLLDILKDQKRDAIKLFTGAKAFNPGSPGEELEDALSSYLIGKVIDSISGAVVGATMSSDKASYRYAVDKAINKLISEIEEASSELAEHSAAQNQPVAPPDSLPPGLKDFLAPNDWVVFPGRALR